MRLNGRKSKPVAIAERNGVTSDIIESAKTEMSAHVPYHVAIIMDGNGRWAKERGMSRQAGHRAGTENIRRIIQAFGERGVGVLTLYAFSTENWTRPRREVNALMRLIPRVVEREVKELHKNGARLLHIGSLEPLDPALRKKVEDAIELTKNNTRMTVALAFNYGGRTEIVDAVRRIVAAGVPPDRIDEALVAANLSTAGLPDPDLIIRTGGEVRVSNFLLWQSAYAEFYATPAYWPDFDESEIDRALLAYAQRQRRFGGVEARNGAK
ncbi:MAG TPA: polyprenyl diphosphate synthase [Dehalococcoidia bacterium]